MERAKRLTAAGVLLALALLTVATQLTSLQREVINWDESTFMLMAQDLLRGHLPYTALFDNKPPLVFFVIAEVFAVFGQSLEAVRWFGDACILATAAMVFGMLRGRAGTMVAALVAALFVAAHVPDFGLFTSSEIIANVPLTAALWILLDRGERGWAGWGAGFLMSLAVLTRSNLAFVVVAVGLLYLVALFRPKAVGLARFGIVGFVVGGLIPLAAIMAVYAAYGAFADFWLATVTVPLSFAGQRGAPGVVKDMVLWWVTGQSDPVWTVRILSALLVVGVAALVLRRDANLAARAAWLSGIWLFAILLSIGLGGVFIDHYVLQIYPPAAVLIGLAATRGRWLAPVVGTASVVATALGLYWTAPGGLEVVRNWDHLRAGWSVRAAATAIAADRKPGDVVWPLTAHLVLFYLDEMPPSRPGLHPDNLVRPWIMDPLVAAGYAPADEFGRLMASRPRYLVTDTGGMVVWLRFSPPDLDRFLAWEKAEYVPFFGTSVAVWRRKD